jgi:uridylate kinase
MPNKPTYRRILLKLSGESLMDPQPYGINQQATLQVAQAIRNLQQQGIQIGVVIGGGNIFRGIQADELGLARTPADQMGMLATMINGIALQQALESLGCDARLMSALDCPKVAEPYNWRAAMKHLNKGRILIFVGGTGSPYFTTDTAAALRASEIQADILLKATKVDGVYNKDPKKHPDAKRYPVISYSQVLAEKLGVMDATAIALCMSSRIPILVFNIFSGHSLQEVMEQQQYGTLVTGE